MKRTRQRLTDALTASASVALAWWLFHIAGDWSSTTSLSQFFLFLFCVLGIDRVMSAAIDLVTIAFAPIETLKHRQ
jgi:hypothetical protein